MSAQNAHRTGRLRKATALVPLALLSAAFTASIAGANAPAVTAGKAPAADQTLPDGTAVPTKAIEAPASVSDGDSLGLGLGDADATQIVSTASTSGIPSAALSAYQRAETVINAADKSCNLTWQLIAAIGRVESNHGRANGNVLDTNGLATPGIFGIPLNGSNKTTEILDTDAGQYDNDPPTTARSARCSSSPRPGRSWAWTPTATACATRRTSTTRRSAPPSTSAPAPTTSPRTPASVPRSTATTTRSPTSVSYTHLTLPTIYSV